MHKILIVSHQILVTLFLLHYLLKLVLLLGNRKEQLVKYTKASLPVEIVISVLFLLTGIWLLIDHAVVGTFFYIKLLCVLASIPIAVIGFRKQKKVFATFAVFLIIMAYGLAEMNRKHRAGGTVNTTTVTGDPIAVGKMVYTDKCVMCHGGDGKAGISGAKDLTLTQLTPEQQKDVILNGKSPMPAYKESLTNEQIDAVMQYLGTLKQ